MSLFDSYKRLSGYNMINSFLHPEDAYKAAAEAEQQGYGAAQEYEKPFWQRGMDTGQQLSDATGKLLDPGALENQWEAGYTVSPYAKDVMSQAKESGLDAASSMGLMGSSAAMNNIQQGAASITNADRQQYLDNLMQKYMQGIGLGENLYGVGANMGQTLGDQAMTHGQNQAGLQYGRVAAPNEMFGKLVGAGANLGMNYATGGASGMSSAMSGMFNSPNTPVNG